MDPEALRRLRREYQGAPLDPEAVDPDPFRQLQRWLEEAIAAEVPDPNAMVLATASIAGVPSARVVLLKEIDARGLVFFTNYRSRKARELASNPHAELLFWWPELARQVRVNGTVAKLTRAENEAYFRTRPREAQLGAWASPQSEPIPGRETILERFAAAAARYADREIPLPPFWGGYRVEPQVFEFWQGREHRLHDRVRYRRDEGGWLRERLAP